MCQGGPARRPSEASDQGAGCAKRKEDTAEEKENHETGQSASPVSWKVNAFIREQILSRVGELLERDVTR